MLTLTCFLLLLLGIIVSLSRLDKTSIVFPGIFMVVSFILLFFLVVIDFVNDSFERSHLRGAVRFQISLIENAVESYDNGSGVNQLKLFLDKVDGGWSGNVDDLKNLVLESHRGPEKNN